jgi:hypothetical protein
LSQHVALALADNLEHQTYEKLSWADEPRNISDIPC